MGSSAYAVLVEALGLTSYSISSHIQSCDILAVNFTAFSCRLSSMDSPLQLTDNVLQATVTINGLNPFYVSSDNISLIQSYNSTPSISYIAPTTTTPGGSGFNQSTIFYVYGTMLLSTLQVGTSVYSTRISIGSVFCEYDDESASDTYLLVSCLNLAAGNHTLLINSPLYGDAVVLHNDTVNVDVLITDISFDTNIGSVAGGTGFVVTGAGFEMSDCSWNTIRMTLDDGYQMPVVLTSCNVYSISKSSLYIPFQGALHGLMSGLHIHV